MMTHEKEEEQQQATNLTRVESNIAPIVIAFLEGVQLQGCSQEFHLQDMQEYVAAKAGGVLSPDSPSRILRLLRRQGRIDYKVLSRRQSLYLFLGFKQPSPTAQSK